MELQEKEYHRKKERSPGEVVYFYQIELQCANLSHQMRLIYRHDTSNYGCKLFLLAF